MTANFSINLVGLVLVGVLLQGEPAAALEDARLHVAMKLDMPSAGVSVAPDGRKFLVIVRLDVGIWRPKSGCGKECCNEL